MSEYWIYNTGDVEFADGDVGDRGHEAVVIDQIQRQIVEACENEFEVYKSSWSGKNRFSNDEYIDWEGFKTALAEAYRQELIAQQPHNQEKLEAMDEDRLIIPALKKVGVKSVEWSVANGMMDARDYAMQYWGWKTYRDQHIDTWLWRKQDLDAIVTGIDEIAEHMNWSDKRLAKLGFTINIHSTKKSFTTSYERMKNPPSPTAVANQQPDYATQQANLQTKERELAQMHPAYKRPGVNPFGDHNEMTFKDFILLNEQASPSLNKNPPTGK